MSWEDSRVLITGGAGFIGSHLAEKLTKSGSEVHIADNLSRGRMENIQHLSDKIETHIVDLTKLDSCITPSQDVDYIFHLAASVGGIHYINRENVAGSTPSILMNTNMLEAARINDIDRFLFASSACIYEERESRLNIFREDDAYPAKPHTTYGWAKLMGEIQCRSYHLDYGIKCSAPRIFNAYGPRENLDPRWSHVIPSMIRKAILYPKEDFNIFGDGKQERAFLHVQDCVDGLMLNMEKVTDAEAINLGGEEIVSIRQLAEKIIDLSGKTIKPQYDPEGTQGTRRYCPDTSRMREVLGWSPRNSLDEGLKETYDWAEAVLDA